MLALACCGFACGFVPVRFARLSCPRLRFVQLDEVGRERQMQRQGAWRAEALAEGSVELAQAMVPQALVLARGG